MEMVEVVPYDENWPKKYVIEANIIRNIVIEDLITVTHIGSTAVPGLVAKPIIDILIVVRDVKKLDALNEKFEQENYRCLGENGIPGRRFFCKDDNSVHIHAYDETQYERIEALIAFYDYLKDHEDVAKEYGEYKLNLAKLYKNDINAYREHKAVFSKEIEDKAIAYYRNKKVAQI